MDQPKYRVDVSPEMLTFIGTGPCPRDSWPDDCIVMAFSGLEGDRQPTLSVEDMSAIDGGEIVFVVQRAACLRVFQCDPDKGVYHLSGDLRILALGIRDCAAAGQIRQTLQIGRSLELVCQVFAALLEQTLVPSAGGSGLSESDAARIVAARRLVDERWQEKLTLDLIARACGLNRDKLARGFRLLYSSTVADMIAEKRLSGARKMLLATDLPVSTIGYRCGYLNNASFTRAFSRRFGVAPSLARTGASTRADAA